MAGKPARMGGAYDYIIRAFVKAPQVTSPSATTTRSSLWDSKPSPLNEPSQRICSLLGRLAASQQPAAPAAANPRIPCPYPAALSYKNSSIKERISAVLLQMPCRFADKHGECVSCLGAAHAETALTGTEYHHCGDMSLSSLRSRLAFFSESKPAPRALSPS